MEKTIKRRAVYISPASHKKMKLLAVLNETDVGQETELAIELYAKQQHAKLGIS